VCLLIALFQVVPDVPLIVAANRDERYDRPAVAMTVLSHDSPRILGGRDLLAGGTWLAVSESGLVAGLTNRPSPDGPDPGKRSRGELPLAFARGKDAAEAVRTVVADVDPAQYNPCWMLVGDRQSLHFVSLADNRLEAEQLGPGLHILENASLQPASPKAALVSQLVQAERADRADPVAALEAVLRSHQPAVTEPLTYQGRTFPAEISAACVHTEGYGTRSAMTAAVPASGRPRLRVADGRPCEVPFRDVGAMWDMSVGQKADADRPQRRSGWHVQ
jgi:uncharacterized protein with NRDE domain